jgi:hypothetical protein
MPKNAVPFFTPNGTLTVALTVNSTTVDYSSRRLVSITSPVACIIRHLPTSSKGSYKAVPIAAGVPLVRGINIASPFVNVSGCTGGVKEIM